jgi:hypothetical protein
MLGQLRHYDRPVQRERPRCLYSALLMFFSPPEKKLMEGEREKKGQTSQQHAEKIKSWKIYNPASDICALIVDTALSEKKSSDHVLAFFPNLVWILDYMYSKRKKEEVLLCLSTVKRTQSSQSVDVRDAAQLE